MPHFHDLATVYRSILFAMLRQGLSSTSVVGLLCLLLGGAIVGAAWALSGDSSGGANGRGAARLSFDPAPGSRAAVIQDEDGFPLAVATINRELDLPDDIDVRVVGRQAEREAGVDGPEYVPKERTIYFPWSFVRKSAKDLENLPRYRKLSAGRRQETLKDAMAFALFHELGHGVIDILDLPVIASQEAVADDFATIFAIASGEGRAAVPLSVVELDEAETGGDRQPAWSRYADDHGFSLQRAFNALCLVYGSDRDRFQSLVDSGDLPASRAELCPFDYRSDLRNWRRLLGAALTDQGGLRPPE